MNNKSIAVDILEEYASGYSRADIDRLAARFDEREKAMRKETAREFAEKLLDTKFKLVNDYYIYADNIKVIAKQYGVEVEE